MSSLFSFVCQIWCRLGLLGHQSHKVTLFWLLFSGISQPMVENPRPATGASRCAPESRPGSVRRRVVFGALWARAPECPKKCPESVPRNVRNTFLTLRGTLSGHFLDTPEPGAQMAPKTPRRTLPGLDAQNRQSLAFSERCQLSQAIPQFHVERVSNE